MQLLQIKIRGLGSTPSTDWLALNPHLNIFKGQSASYQTSILAALETINPPFFCLEKIPFSNFPLETRHNGYSKRIAPHKRTVSLAIFAAPPQLAIDLGQFSEFLYETDRIEIGRRLNYSRWLNFVEISSSTRWGEVSTDFETLADTLRRRSPETVRELTRYIDELAPGDRIKHRLMDQLATWISGLPALPEDLESLAGLTRRAVLRAERFHKARLLVFQRLPLFALINPSDGPAALLRFISQKAHEAKEQDSDAKGILVRRLNEQLTMHRSMQTDYVLVESADQFVLSDRIPPDTASPLSTRLNQLKASVELASAISNVLYQTHPILLFAEPDKYMPEKDFPDLLHFLFECAEKSQCLCSFSNFALLKKIPHGINDQDKRRLHYIQLGHG